VASVRHHSGAAAQVTTVSARLDLKMAGMFGKAQEFIGSEWLMLYGMFQYRLMGNPSRTSAFDDMLDLSL
jgi:hypothetical protein